MVLGDFVSINTFIGGMRGGHKWCPESLLSELKLKRAYCTFGEIWDYNSPGKLALDFTHKNWYYKESLQEYKRQGVKILLAMAGGFYSGSQPGDINKIMPINPTDDPYSPNTYKPIANICYDIASLYGANTEALLHPERFQTTVTGSNPRKATEAIAGQDLIWCMEIQQEGLGWGDGWKMNGTAYTTIPKQVWNNVKQVHNPKTFAISFYECLKAIWQADPDMNVSVGALVHNKPEHFTLFNQEFKTLTGHDLKDYPNSGQGKIYWQVHNYLRNQARTHADFPENHNLQIPFWDSIGVPYGLTEFGADTVNNNTNLLCPLIANLNIEQSQWEYNWRHILWYSTGKNCFTATPYEIRNEEDLGGQIFRTCGMYKDNSTYAPKAGEPIFKDIFQKAKDLILPSVHTFENGYHTFRFQNGTARYQPNGRIEIIAGTPPPTQEPITSKTFSNKTLLLNNQYQISMT